MHKQAEHGNGILHSSMGFMITSNTDVNVDAEENISTNQEAASEKRKTKCEYLKVERKTKSAQKSKKDMTRSFKDQFLTLKKNISNLQKVHGVEAEFVLIMKNNIQMAGGKNQSPTAGQYMVSCEGEMKNLLFSTGIKFGEGFVIMANDCDMQIKQPET